MKLNEPFSEGTSYLHRADPRAKVATAFMLALFFTSLTHLITAFCALALSISLALLAQLPLSLFLKRLAFVNFFILFLWLVLPFSTSGEALYTITFSSIDLTITLEGILKASLITLKSNAILIALMALVATSTITDIGHAMAAIGVPHKFAMLLLFTWRYLHVIAEEYYRLLRAAHMRGFIATTNSHTYTTYANLIAMVLVQSYDRSIRVQEAMYYEAFTVLCTAFMIFSTAPHDVLFCILCTFLGGAIFFANYFFI